MFVIDIPVNAEGQGPASPEETVRIQYEVWTHDFVSLGAFNSYEEAWNFIDFAQRECECDECTCQD